MEAELDFVTHSGEATEDFAGRLGARLIELAERGASVVIALDGDLGAGKTTFVRGLCRGLGVGPDEDVSSPTYTLMHEYRGRVPVYHFDAWMEGREEAFLEGGGAEWFFAGGVSVVEWADRVANWLPEPRLAVRLSHLAPEERRLELGLVGEDPALTALLAQLGTPS